MIIDSKVAVLSVIMKAPFLMEQTDREIRLLSRKTATVQPRPQGFFLKKWVGREKALASAGHVSPRTP